jgi:hypothetical protein
LILVKGIDVRRRSPQRKAVIIAFEVPILLLTISGTSSPEAEMWKAQPRFAIICEDRQPIMIVAIQFCGMTSQRERPREAKMNAL